LQSSQNYYKSKEYPSKCLPINRTLSFGDLIRTKLAVKSLVEC